MARPAIGTLDAKQQYFSVMTKADDTTVLNQVKSVDWSVSSSTEKAGRIGASTKKVLATTKEATASFEIYEDDDLADVSFFLGETTPPATTETIKLDPTNAAFDIHVQNYDAEDVSATLLHTTKILGFVPTEFSMSMGEDDLKVYSISGECTDVTVTMA